MIVSLKYSSPKIRACNNYLDETGTLTEFLLKKKKKKSLLYSGFILLLQEMSSHHVEAKNLIYFYRQHATLKKNSVQKGEVVVVRAQNWVSSDQVAYCPVKS